MTGTTDFEPFDDEEKIGFGLEKINAICGELSHALHRAMKKGITQAVIAKRLGYKDRSRVSRIFGAPKNMTVRSLSEIVLALDCDIEFNIIPWEEKKRSNMPKIPAIGLTPASQPHASGQIIKRSPVASIQGDSLSNPPKVIAYAQ